MHRERRYQRHHAVRNRVRPPYEDQHRQRNAWPEEREDPEQHGKDSAQHDPVPSAGQISQHRWNSHISPPWPQALTRIEMRQFGAGRASQHLALYIDLPVHPLISPRITTLILLDTVPPSTCKVPPDSCFFLRQALPSETKDRFSCFMPRPVSRGSLARAAYGRSPTQIPCSSES